MAQLIAALDYTNAEDALATAESLRGCPIWMKVGLELFTHEGPAVVKKLKDMGFKVMLDLKMFDIPNTVAGGVRSACLMGVDLITLHALGGERMIHAAVDAVRQSAEEGGPKPLLFAVTVLTSMAPGELPGYGENLSGLAADLAAGGQAWGLDGVVCSGHEVEAIKSRCPGLMCLTPGIRPASGSASDDQRRIMTPAQAVRIGSDFLVVGRPITKAPVPADAARAILDAGLTVPGDISVLGFDGIPMARFYNPQLATMRQPAAEIAGQSVKLLLRCIEKRQPAQTVLLEATPTPGGSVRAI